MNEYQYAGDKWPTPKSFGVGLFTDFRLYWESLEIANSVPLFSIEDIIKQLPHRVKGLLYVEGFKRRAYQDLIRELTLYNFIEKINNVSYKITDVGIEILSTYKNDSSKALSILLGRMQEVFVTPAWFINRLWELNIQGQIVIPTPIKDWKAKSRLCYVDTCILSDILKQYNPLHPYKPLVGSRFLKNNMLNEINRAIESEGDSGMIITSSFSFVELVNKFDDIFKDSKIRISSICNFIKQPPLWITFEDVNDLTALSLCDVPQTTPNGDPISGDDAIHIATALSRGESIIFCTTDTKMEQLKIEHVTFMCN